MLEVNKCVPSATGWYGHVEVAKVLIENGAEVNAVNQWERQHFTTQLKVDMLML